MSSRTCAYVASKANPESWHGTDSSAFLLDRDPASGGLGITEWHCPHPPLERDDGDEQYCVFHTDPAEMPDDVDQRKALLEALDDAGDSPRPNRPEHRGQFIGATFGAIDLSDETIVATDSYDIRFDHAQFRTDDRNLDFKNTTFVTQGQRHVSFAGAKFISDGDGDVLFADATLTNADLRGVDFAEADLHGAELTGTILWEANIADITVNGTTTCRRLYDEYGSNRSTTNSFI